MSNVTEIPAFDPNSAVEAIRARIRGALLDVIPDSQWDAMIRAEMQAFMHDSTTKRDQWSNPVTVEAGFKKIVREMLETQARERVKALLGSPEWIARWGTGDQEASEAVQRYVTENAGLILNKWVASAVQQVVSQLSYQR